MKRTFGEYIRELRIKSHLTQTQLGALINIEAGNLSKIECGKRLFDENKLEKLAEAVNIDSQILKEEFFSDKMAQVAIKYKISNTVFTKAEEKVAVYETRNTIQGKLKL